MKSRLRIEVIPFPTPDALRDQDACLDVLADALADRLIARARAGVAREMGVDARKIDREAGRVSREEPDMLGFPRILEGA